MILGFLTIEPLERLKEQDAASYTALPPLSLNRNPPPNPLLDRLDAGGIILIGSVFYSKSVQAEIVVDEIRFLLCSLASLTFTFTETVIIDERFFYSVA